MTSVSHQPRINQNVFYKTAPAVTAALIALSQAVDDSGLDKSLTELVKLRVSQINGCAFCVQYHLNHLRQIGVDASKLDLVIVWRDAGVFTEREQAALAWSEALTAMATAHVSDDVYSALQTQFNESEIIFLTAAISNITAWNRIAGALHFAPPIPA